MFAKRNFTVIGFNTQPPEGGWVLTVFASGVTATVSTHSRLKAAGAPA